MPQRTDNDIKNRWNSIIRKQQHPSGREWLPHENDARAAILGSASRAQGGGPKVRGTAEEAAAVDGTAKPPQPRKRQRTVGNGGMVPGTSGSLMATLGDAKVGMRRLGEGHGGAEDGLEDGKHDDISPTGPQARKLFVSPEAVPFESRRDDAGAEEEVRLVRVNASDEDGGNLAKEGRSSSHELRPPPHRTTLSDATAPPHAPPHIHMPRTLLRTLLRTLTHHVLCPCAHPSALDPWQPMAVTTR